MKKITSGIPFICFISFCCLFFVENSQAQEVPKDNFYDQYLHKEKQILAYDFIHEKDVLWEKRVWRLIDFQEKKNQIFNEPNQPFVKILIGAAQSGKINLYHVFNDQFTHKMTAAEMLTMGVSVDTICIFDPDGIMTSRAVDYNGNPLDSAAAVAFFANDCAPVTSELNYEEMVTKIRIKEVYYFDEETSSMGVRILGLAPIMDRFDDNGYFLNSGPMFWVYYPEVRALLAQKKAPNVLNDVGVLSWEDVFEARMFSSYIIKGSNLRDQRIKDYISDPITMLLESDRIGQSIFNMEHDFWSY